MTKIDRQAMTVFLDVWIPEFKQSVEMFTGNAIVVEQRGQAEPAAPKSSDSGVLWLGQAFTRESSGTVWVGTPIETYTEVAQELAGDAAGRESIYRELLEQSFETMVQAINTESQQKLVRGQVTKSATQPSDLAILETLALTFQSKLLKSIVVGFDPAFSKISLQENRTATVSETEKPERRSSPPLERLTDLELPVAVVLGRTKLRIRDALKLTAGSLIELDHRVGEPVEIVVHNVVVARGEVVSVKGNYAVQIQDVSTPGQRYALKASATSRSSLAQLQSALSNDSAVLSPSSVQ